METGAIKISRDLITAPLFDPTLGLLVMGNSKVLRRAQFGNRLRLSDTSVWRAEIRYSF